MIVHVSSILHEYTQGRSELAASGATVGEVLDDLERRHPGLRFRIVDEQDAIRPHIRLFLGARTAAGLGERVGAGDELHIIQALSGG